jgi:hypothetical protein
MFMIPSTRYDNFGCETKEGIVMLRARGHKLPNTRMHF